MIKYKMAFLILRQARLLAVTYSINLSHPSQPL